MSSPLSNYKLHHVGLVIPSFEAAFSFMSLMDLKESYRGEVSRWSCCCIFTVCSNGGSIEIVVPDGGALARFNRGGAGVHHYAYQVDDIAEASAHCVKKGMALVEPEPIRGAGNFLCNFIHPISTRGIQIELIQEIN